MKMSGIIVRNVYKLTYLTELEKIKHIRFYHTEFGKYFVLTYGNSFACNSGSFSIFMYTEPKIWARR